MNYLMASTREAPSTRTRRAGGVTRSANKSKESSGSSDVSKDSITAPQARVGNALSAPGPMQPPATMKSKKEWQQDQYAKRMKMFGKDLDHDTLELTNFRLSL